MKIVAKSDRFLSKKKYSFGDFVEIIHILRQPSGCPWDREQTHESIRKSLIEETYEAVEAIDLGDTALLREELGDVMLQILLHSEMEAEKGNFTVEDVIDDECRKMIYRHPHVFGDVSADTSDAVLDNWDKLKKKEKHQKTETDTLRSVASSLPSLMRAYKVRKKACKAGLDMSGSPERLSMLTDEYISADGEAKKKLVGRILFEAVGLALECEEEPEESLTMTVNSFIDEFEKRERDGTLKQDLK